MNRKVGIVLSGIVGVVAGLWVWSAVIPKDSIQIGGSTSVSNVMTNLESAYKTYQENEFKNDKDSKDKKADSFIYSSVGSAAGINSAKSGTYKMGFISKNLDYSVPGVTYVDSEFNKDLKSMHKVSDRQKAIYTYFKDTKKTAKNSDMHYVQIANDAIIIAYQAPDWFKDNFKDLFSLTIDKNGVSDSSKEIMRNIYAGKYTWKDLAKELIKNDSSATKPEIKDSYEDAEIQPLASSAGSGTKTVFDDKFGFDKDKHAADQLYPSVRPSDGFMFDSIKKNNIGYLSMNYLGEIQKDKDLVTVRVNGVNPQDSSFTPSELSEDISKNKGYLLVRPYIGVVNAKSSDDDLRKLADFLGWISEGSNENSEEYKSVYEQYKKANLAPEFRLDDKELLPKEKEKQEELKTEKSETNDKLKQTINTGYVKQQ